MTMAKEKKKDIISGFKTNPKDTGSSQVQIALLTERIRHLTEHLKNASKDYASRRGLFDMVGQRRQLLSYLKSRNPDQYQSIIQKLDLRK